MHKMTSMTAKAQCKCSSYINIQPVQQPFFFRKSAISFVGTALGYCWAVIHQDKLSVTTSRALRHLATSHTNRSAPENASAKHIMINNQSSKTALPECEATPNTTPYT